jgi:hypothetical protein
VLDLNSGTVASSTSHAAVKALAIRFDPVALGHHLQGQCPTLQKPDQANALLDLAVIAHQARRRDLHSGIPGPHVMEQNSATIGKMIQGILQCLALSRRCWQHFPP